MTADKERRSVVTGHKVMSDAESHPGAGEDGRAGQFQTSGARTIPGPPKSTFL